MGATGLFKRRRERESAIPPGTLEAGTIEPRTSEPKPATATRPAPIPKERPASYGDRSIADELTTAAGGDLAAHVERLRSLLREHSADPRALPAKERKAVVRDLNRRGVPAKEDGTIEVTDIPQVHATAAVLKKRGLLPNDAELPA